MLARIIAYGVLVAASTLAGCRAAPAPSYSASVTASSPTTSVADEIEPLEQSSDVEVIRRWSNTPTPTIQKEIERRKLFTDIDWKFVREKQVGLGMSELGVLAVKGYPDDVVRTNNAFGKTAMFTYGKYTDYALVYFSEGRVTQVTSW